MAHASTSSTSDDPLLGDVHGFLASLFGRLAEMKCDVSAMQCDHVCFRVETPEDYDTAKANLSQRATLLTEHEIGGRPIATYALHDPIRFREREIRLIELPAPKKTSYYARGLEHAEFVLPAGTSFEAFMHDHSHLTFDLDAIHKKINPDIRLALSSAMSVKFHHEPLDVVIEHERALGLH